MLTIDRAFEIVREKGPKQHELRVALRSTTDPLKAGGIRAEMAQNRCGEEGLSVANRTLRGYWTRQQRIPRLTW